LDFWAMWCSPCVRDIPSLVDAYSKFPRGKLEIVGISKDRDAETVRSFMEENNVTWPNILDEQKRKGSIAATYNIYMLPTSYFIGPDGTIISKWHCQENLTQKLKELIDSWDAKSSR
jgi:peroxiredoxin